MRHDIGDWLANASDDVAALNADKAEKVDSRRTEGSERVEGHDDSRKRPISAAEQRFWSMWNWLGGPALEREYRFDCERRWRFDFAHLASSTAFEVEGGTWQYGRHNRPDGFREDAEKYNAAALGGWVVLRLVPEMIQPDYLEQLMRFIDDWPDDD